MHVIKNMRLNRERLGERTLERIVLGAASRNSRMCYVGHSDLNRLVVQKGVL